MQAMENKWTRLGVLISFSGFRSFRVHHFKGVCLVLNNVERLFSLLASLGLLVFFFKPKPVLNYYRALTGPRVRLLSAFIRWEGAIDVDDCPSFSPFSMPASAACP